MKRTFHFSVLALVSACVISSALAFFTGSPLILNVSGFFWALLGLVATIFAGWVIVALIKERLGNRPN